MALENVFHSKVVAVTGGAGLIGSFVADELVAAGAKVVIVDDFSKGMYSNLANCASRVEVRTGNLEDRIFTREALADAEYVLHLASRAYGIGYSENHHLEALLHNEQVTNNLLEQMAETPPRHLLVTSSSCVYRDDGPDTVAESPVFDGDPEKANLGYGWAKRILEQKFSILAGQTGLPVTVVRPFNIYGERYRWVGAYSQAIPMLVKRILDGENPVVVWGSGQQRRTYLHARDCARIMLRLVAQGHRGTPVNIGLEETVSIRELVETICRVAGKAPQICFDSTKPEGRFVKSSDATLLRSLLGDFPVTTVDLEEGIRRMLGWYAFTFPEGAACA